DNQVARVDYQAYEGFEVRGQAERVYLRGQLVVEDGHVVKEHTGAYVRRGKRMELD
ncbi:MAG: dihydropyrimidinase, partial [Hungatella sp.]